MIFSLKMASKSRQFSMKKPSKKQDVFRASQKSFFWRSWSAPGQCPMAVFIFFFVFLDFWSKMSTWRTPSLIHLGILFSTWFSNPPRGHPRDRFWCHFGRHFGPKWRLFWPLFDVIDGLFCQKASKMHYKTMKQISKLQKLHPQMRIRIYMSTIRQIVQKGQTKKH